MKITDVRDLITKAEDLLIDRKGEYVIDDKTAPLPPVGQITIWYKKIINCKKAMGVRYFTVEEFLAMTPQAIADMINNDLDNFPEPL